MRKTRVAQSIGVSMFLLWAIMLIDQTQTFAAEEENEEEKTVEKICNTEPENDPNCPVTGKRYVKICYQNGQKISSNPQQCVE